ncbi:MAG: response regulator, partial [Planctomycetes bacterium]|nr:response regulator [Planctomycetota bacterium]
GIGLTLVKRLVEMHGGTVAVRSEGRNRGSEFIVRLPILAEMPLDEAREGLSDGAEGCTARRRVLVVDDNAAAANMLSMAVKMLGHDVRTAGDGREAIQIAAEFCPDVVLMDLGMPQMNGYEAARRIRRQAWGKSIVLIALTGWGHDDDKRRTKEAGFDHHLVKPAEPAELRRLLAPVERN